MSERFRVECLRCGSVWDCRVPKPSWCKFCRAPMSLDVRRQKREYNRLYNKAHPEILRWYNRNQRARRKGVLGSFTDEEFVLKCKAFGNRCAYCGGNFVLIADHAIPISRGGNDNIANIIPSCSDCNSKKGTMTYDEFVRYFRHELVKVLQVRSYMNLHIDAVAAVRRKHFL